MKQTMKLAVLLLGLAVASFGQTALTQTTLNGAVSGQSVYFGNATPSIDTQVTLTAVTNVTAPSSASNQFKDLYSSTQGGQFATEIYVDSELMGVTGVNTTTKVVQVIRGIEGTSAQDHASGQMVLIGPPGAFQKYDPKGSCTSTGTLFTPWVNVVNGYQWLCSTVSNNWVPGFGNALAPIMSQVTTAVASVAGSTLPSGPLFHVTGTNAITGWTIPVGCDATAVGGCQFTIIPDAVCTWTAAGNIALAGSCVVNKALTFVWDAKNSKWIPNYIA